MTKRCPSRTWHPASVAPPALVQDPAVREEMAALPGPEYAVALLERLAAARQPIVAGG